MISARRAALQGLTVPLSPIMIAVLGLWPEPEEVTVPDDVIFKHGGRQKKREEKEPRKYDWHAERMLQEAHRAYEEDMVALAIGLVFSGALDG